VVVPRLQLEVELNSVLKRYLRNVPSELILHKPCHKVIFGHGKHEIVVFGIIVFGGCLISLMPEPPIVLSHAGIRVVESIADLEGSNSRQR
jgi:hypothetical protein